DVIQPGREAGPRLIARARAVQAKKHLLRQIRRVLAVAEQAKEVAEDACAVAIQQLGKRMLVVVADAEHEPDVGIVVLAWFDFPGSFFPGQRRGGSHRKHPRFVYPSSGIRSSHAGRLTLNVEPWPSILSTSMVP